MSSSSFEDQKAALRMRDIIDKRIESKINQLRPDLRIGKVFSYDEGSGIARILFPGSDVDNLATVRFAVDKMPSVAMVDTFQTDGYDAAGNVVRVGGKAGSLFILDFVSGSPRSNVTLPPGPINFNGEKGIGAKDPTSPQDVATKAYVDSQLETASSKTFSFPSAATQWIIDHNFAQSSVSVTLTDMNNVQIEADMSYPTNNRAIATFFYPNSGIARVRR